MLESWGVLQPIFVPVITITLLTTILVMVAAGRVTQFVIRMEGRAGKKGGRARKDPGVEKEGTKEMDGERGGCE